MKKMFERTPSVTEAGGATAARREQRPDPVQDSHSDGSKPEIPLGDPEFHYRIVSVEKDAEGRVEHHRDKGYRVAKQTNRFAVMGCPKEDFEARQRGTKQRSEDRLAPYAGEPSGDQVKDETSIEETTGLGLDDD